jgi:hypothetical protein
MQVEVMEVVGDLGEEYLENGEAEIAENSEDHMYGTFETSVQQPPAWFTEFLQQYHNDEERRIEMLNKMHADIIAVEEKKCALLATLIEKLGGGPAASQETGKCESSEFQRPEKEPE